MNLFRRLERVWDIEGISKVQKLVLANLAFRADEKTLDCHPSAQRIGADTGMDRRNVHRVIKQLVTKGLLLVESSGSAKGRNSPNKYRLVFLEMTSPRRHSEGNECRHSEQVMSSFPPVNAVTTTHEPLNHKETVAARPNASAPALEARAPRRSRTPEPGESPEAKRRRQLLDVAALLRLQPEVNEPEHLFLERVVLRKTEWDRARGLQ